MATLNRSALNRKTATSLLKKITDSETKKSYDDDRFWQPTVDTQGNGMAVIRFLPSKSEESLPYIKQWSQSFKVNNKWFINLCPTTLNLPSPAVEHTNDLYGSGVDSDKKLGSERKRRLHYFANVLVVKDPKNPENEGKIKIFKFGAKIFEKLMAVINPSEEYGEKPGDPFSFFDGYEFKLKMKKKDGFRNYDDSQFIEAGDLFDGDEDKLTEILEQLHDIDALNDPKNFKSYDDLKKELYRVLGENVASEGSAITDRREEQRSTSNYTSSSDRHVEAAIVGAVTGIATKAVLDASSSDADYDADLAEFAAMTSDD